jgi:feruloyl esterase
MKVKIALTSLLMTATALCGFGDDLAVRFERVRNVADSICSITNVVLLERGSAKTPNPLAMWAAIQDDEGAEKIKGLFVRVDFLLKPEKGSDIRCRAELPPPRLWDGRMWGQGNSGHAGVLPSLTTYTAAGTAGVTTDLGTWMITDFGKRNSKIWPANVRRDFEWRATHLMTVYGKKIIKAFYERPCDRAYFCGGSTGGRQGMSEAIRYPEDYDGIISSLPANSSAVNEIAVWHLWRQTHDENGKSLFSTNEMRVVSDAAVDYRKSKEPAPFAGHAISDSRLPESEIDGFLALAAERCPSLNAGDKMARLKRLYLPLVHDGKCYFNGFAPGSYLGKNMSWMGIVNFRSYLLANGIGYSRWKDIGWKEIDGYLKEYAPDFNACSADLSAFRRRGGKIIMTTGWEDQTVPPAPIIDYYERVCEQDGGIEKTLGYFRLFCIPGCAHGGGRGRLLTASPGGPKLRRQLSDWCERGISPDRIMANWTSKAVEFPVAAYPGLFVHNASGKWIRRETPRGVERIGGECIEMDCCPERRTCK